MSDWRVILQQSLNPANKVAVLGAGSELCGDDAVGMIIAHKLDELGANIPNLLALPGSTAPENFIGVIRSFAPHILIIVDAAYIDGNVGDIAVIAPEDINGMSFSTHMLPFNVLIDFLKAEVNCQVMVFGIKPGSVEFADNPSDTIIKSADIFANEIIKLMQKNNP